MSNTFDFDKALKELQAGKDLTEGWCFNAVDKTANRRGNNR